MLFGRISCVFLRLPFRCYFYNIRGTNLTSPP